MRLRRLIPLAFGSFLLLVVAVAGASRAFNASGAQAALTAAAVAIYLVWGGLESWLVSAREVSLPDAKDDKGSCEMYALAQGLTVMLAVLLPGARFSLLASAVGLAILVGGAGFRLSAILTLGRFYSRRVRLLASHRVVTTGPYRLVRHPAYLGTLAGHLGFILVFGHWAPLLIWAVLFIPMVVRRIVVEEPVLFELEGYSEYARGRKRLLPFVW